MGLISGQENEGLHPCGLKISNKKARETRSNDPREQMIFLANKGKSREPKKETSHNI